jgi:hypothetical protein
MVVVCHPKSSGQTERTIRGTHAPTLREGKVHDTLRQGFACCPPESVKRLGIPSPPPFR